MSIWDIFHTDKKEHGGDAHGGSADHGWGGGKAGAGAGVGKAAGPNHMKDCKAKGLQTLNAIRQGNLDSGKIDQTMQEFQNVINQKFHVDPDQVDGVRDLWEQIQEAAEEKKKDLLEDVADSKGTGAKDGVAAPAKGKSGPAKGKAGPAAKAGLAAKPGPSAKKGIEEDPSDEDIIDSTDVRYAGDKTGSKHGGAKSGGAKSGGAKHGVAAAKKSAPAYDEDPSDENIIDSTDVRYKGGHRKH